MYEQQEHRLASCTFPTRAYASTGGWKEKCAFRAKTWEEVHKERLITYSVFRFPVKFLSFTPLKSRIQLAHLLAYGKLPEKMQQLFGQGDMLSGF